MLGLIGNFKFEIHNTHNKSIEHTTEYSYAVAKPLKGHFEYQSVGRFEEEIEISGFLLVKSQRALRDFERLAELKRAVLFVTNEAIKVVVITSIKKLRSNFLNNGMFLKQEYKISLKVLKHSSGLMSWIESM